MEGRDMNHQRDLEGISGNVDRTVFGCHIPMLVMPSWRLEQ